MVQTKHVWWCRLVMSLIIFSPAASLHEQGVIKMTKEKRKVQEQNKSIGRRLKKLRNHLGYTPPEMAGRLMIRPNGYYKNEVGLTRLSLVSLDILQTEFGVSMDWLFFEKGPMFYGEKHDSETGMTESDNAFEVWQEIVKTMPDIKELLEYMPNDPLFRHEMLAYFYKYKEKKEKDSKKVSTME